MTSPCLGSRLHARPLNGRLGSAHRTRRLSTVCLMGGYQYQRRADRLRQQGVQVLEFGSRVLEEQCYGEDVVSLQLLLGQEGYINLRDGITGYFGGVTREALMNWQRDVGLPVTGVFTEDCKMAYLKQLEARTAEAATAVASVPASSAHLALATNPLAVAPAWQVWLGAAALAAAAFITLNRPRRVPSGAAPAASRAASGPAPELRQHLRGFLRNAGAAVASAGLLLVAAARGMLLASLKVLGATAALAALMGTAGCKLLLTTLRAAAAATAATAVALGALAATAASDVGLALAAVGDALKGAPYPAAAQGGPAQAREQRAPPAARHAAGRVLSEEEEELLLEVAWDEPARYGAKEVHKAPAPAPAPAQQARPAAAGPKQAPRMSEAELQKQLAAMKGEGPRRSTVQPAPRPLPPREQTSNGGDPFVNSKYGTYFGGQQTRDQIREYLQERNPPPNNGPARRMQAIGYPIPSTNKPRQPSGPQPAANGRPFNPRAAPPAPRQQQEEQQPLSPLAMDGPGEVARTTAAFEDVVEPRAVRYGGTAAATGLLAGTELEAVPESRPYRPVKVRRPGSNDEEPTGVLAVAAQQQQQWQQQGVAVAPAPVVKRGPATVGEMMRSSMEEEMEAAEGEALWQGPLYAPSADAAGPAVSTGPVPVRR